MQIGPYDVNYLEWGDPENTYLNVYLVGQPFPLSYFDNQPYWSALIGSGLSIRPFKPSQFYSWNGSAWFFDQTIFTPFLRAQIDEYRANASAQTVAYNGISVINNLATRQFLIERIAYLETKNQDIEINYNSSLGYVQMSLADFKGLLIVCGDLEALSHDAAAYVLSLHAVTPYEDTPPAFVDFDIKFEELQGI